MKITPHFVFLTFLPVALYGASFDCSKAQSEVEHAICDNKVLGSLDVRLSGYYSKLKEHLSDAEKSALIADQRLWLRERNERCEQSGEIVACLDDAYRDRISTFQVVYGEKLLPNEAVSNEFCQLVTNSDLSELLELGERSINFSSVDTSQTYDINNDGVHEQIDVCWGGTMNESCLDVSSASGDKIIPEPANFDWRTHGATNEYALQVGDHWFHVHANDGRSFKPVFVSYLTPVDSLFALCEFEHLESEEMVPNPKVVGSNEVCSALSYEGSGAYKSLRLNGESSLRYEYLREIGRRETHAARQGFIDYDNDGTPNHLVELKYASGAGAGCDYNYFDEISENGTELIASEGHSLLLQMQKVNLDNRHPNCGSQIDGQYANRFFGFNEKVYFEHSTRDERSVLKIEDGEVVTVCDFEKSYEVRIK